MTLSSLACARTKPTLANCGLTKPDDQHWLQGSPAGTWPPNPAHGRARRKGVLSPVLLTQHQSPREDSLHPTSQVTKPILQPIRPNNTAAFPRGSTEPKEEKDPEQLDKPTASSPLHASSSVLKGKLQPGVGVHT